MEKQEDKIGFDSRFINHKDLKNIEICIQF